MKREYLVVVDMQNDFVTGTLGTPQAAALCKDLSEYVRSWAGTVVYTLDTHDADYLNTQEGKHLPVSHCVRGTYGWQLIDELDDLRVERGLQTFEKPTFGSVDLAHWLANQHALQPIDAIELVGVCTDICVVSNALLIKATLPEVPVRVHSALCAGTTPAAHEASLATMVSCQIELV